MSHAVAVVVEQRVLSRQPPGTLVEIFSQSIRINKRLEHRDMPILIRIRIRGIQGRDEKSGETRRVRLLPITCRGNDDASLCRKALDELAARTGHVENDDAR